MDKNVILKYSELASKAKDYVRERVPADLNDLTQEQKAFNEFVLLKLAELFLTQRNHE